MEYVAKILKAILSLTSKSTKKTLDILENFHGQFYKLLTSGNDYTKDAFSVLSSFELQLKSYSPFSLIAFGILLVFLYLFLKTLFKKVKKTNKYIKKIKNFVITLFLSLPSNKIKLQKANEDAKKGFQKAFKSNKYKSIEFRDNKQDYTRILAKIEQNMQNDTQNAKCGKLTGAVYCDNDQTKYIATEAAKMFLYTNLLHTDLFTYARFMESELIKIGLDLFNGKEDSCGITTSGGTYSILHAMYAYAHRARILGIKKPELIIPKSAHAAFLKACDLFRVKAVEIPLDKNYKVDLKKVVNNINKNTMCIVGSFPNYCHSNYDDIESLSKIAVKYNIPLHVDCCLGGFLVAFHERAGINTPKFDFRLPGVTSISADLHKYGLCPKGISLLMFSKHEYRRYIYFKYAKFMGGVYVTPTFDGSRTAALIASSYAILTSLGKEHYTKIAKDIHDAVIKVKEFIQKECDLITVLGDPSICGIAFTASKKICENFYDLLSKKGFHMNYLNYPIGVGYIFTSANVGNVDLFIKDLKEVHERIKKGDVEPVGDICKLYGMAIEIPDVVSNSLFDLLADAMLD